MKKNIIKAISMVLSASLIFGLGIGVSAGTSDNLNVKNDIVQNEADGSDIDLNNLISTDTVDKEETVYVIAGADGSVEKVIVSELLKNPGRLNELTDATGLSDIVNVKSDAAYTMSGTSCVWNAQGEDIYYRGTTKEEIPVLLKISFMLDGKNVSADEIAGKSGAVEIKIDYVNNCKRTVEIDGKSEEMYVPFLMISGMILDNDNFRHVTVDNGKVIDDGDKTIVAGFALPGLRENLTQDDDADIPSSITIKADVTDFSLTTTLTIASNEIFNRIDISNTDKIDELKEQLDLLDSSMKKLVDGSSELYGYLTQLLDKSGELIVGINTLDDYANQISESVDRLYNEAVVYIDGKLAELSGGLDELSGHSAELNDGAKQVFDTLICTVQSQLEGAGLDALGIKVPELTVENYGTELEKLIKALDENSVRTYAEQIAGKTVTAKVNENDGAIRSQVTQAVKVQVTETVKAQVQDEAQVNAIVDAKMNSEEIKKTIEDNVAAQKQKLIEENMAGAEVQAQIAAAVATAKAGAVSIQSAMESLDAYNSFYNGIISYTAGADAAADGCARISAGYTENITANVKLLSDKIKEYVAGIDELNGKAPELETAVAQLTDGAKTLADGTSQFYGEGIKGIIDSAGDITSVITRLKAMLDISKDYQSFGGISEDMTGSTRFIYRTGAIGE